MKKTIESITNLHLLSGKNLSSDDLDNLEFLKQINIPIKAPYFVKLSLSSGKNDRPNEPCYDYKDIAKMLTTSRILLGDLKNSKLIHSPE